MIGAFILAGGVSRRMGYPKALLPIEGRTFLEAIAASYAEAQAEVLAITHRAVFQNPGFPPLPGVQLLLLDRPTESPLQTLWRGLDRIGGRWSAFFVHPVDHPFVKPATLRAMAELHAQESSTLVQPCLKGAGGHPVLLRACLAKEIRAASPAEGLRQVVRADPRRVRRLDTADEGILRGINEPADLR